MIAAIYIRRVSMYIWHTILIPIRGGDSQTVEYYNGALFVYLEFKFKMIIYLILKVRLSIWYPCINNLVHKY